jgi:hypothetical protein
MAGGLQSSNYPLVPLDTPCHTGLKCHRRMARSGHGLPKVSPGSAMPDPSTPRERTTPATAMQPFQGWPAHRAGSLRPSSTSLDTPRRTPMNLIHIPRLSDVSCGKTKEGSWEDVIQDGCQTLETRLMSLNIKRS